MKLAEAIKNDKVKKSASLFITMGIGAIAGLIISGLNTKILGAEEYGDFKYILNVYSFFLTITTFGLFYSLGRKMGDMSNRENQRRFFGFSLIVNVLVFLMLSIFVFIFGLINDSIYNNNLSSLIIKLIPFILILPIQLSFEQVLQGNNRIYSLSIHRLGPKLVYLVLLSLVNLWISLDLSQVLIIHFFSIGLILLLIILIQKPLFNFDKQLLKEFFSFNKLYGFKVYTGAVFGLASGYLSGFTIGYFGEDNTNFGYFSLALTATMPLSMMPATIGTTFFKEFIGMPKIPRKIFLTTVLLSGSILLFFITLIGPIVKIFFDSDFYVIIPFTYALALAACLTGIGDFLNKFIQAKSDGKSLRNTNILLGMVNVLGYSIFVYFWGVYGAILTRVIGSLVYLGILTYYYRRPSHVN